MTVNAVEVTNLGKCYRRPVAGAKNIREDFWALSDVSFEIPVGQVCGIVGKNGAGKSTLLKLLSRITSPTTGEIHMRGRVGSLLEVGTGFHPELSGRDNVFMNGSILGMRRAEISAKFNEIVEFAGVGAFIDTPVKHYSSGMYMRLAFSVAAHLEPEILIVDEVLAVGDAEFQARCLGKMDEVAHNGRTVLLVSHNMNAIRQLCQSVVWLDQGRVFDSGSDVPGLVNRYLTKGMEQTPISLWLPEDGQEIRNEYFRLERFALVREDGEIVSSLTKGDEDVWIEIDVEIKKTHPALNFGYGLYHQSGELLYWSVSTDGERKSWPDISEGSIRLRSKFPKRLFNEGVHYIDFFASIHYQEWLSEPGKTVCRIPFVVSGGLSDSIYWRDSRPGLIAPDYEWHKA